jgi:hypothetical protein
MHLTPSRKHLIASTALLGFVVLLCCLGLRSSASARGGSQCGRQVQVIGVRGSGETDNGGPGKTVGPFIKDLEAQADPGAVRGEGLYYTAVPIIDWKLVLFGASTKSLEYKLSVDNGVASLVKLVYQRVKQCGSTKLVLAGYSQGAHVIRDALGKLKSVSSHIGAVVLFGDPHFDPHSDAAVVEGGFDPKRHGVLGLPDHDFPAAFAPHVATYCRDGDLICQGFPNTTGAHKLYPPKWTGAAAKKVAEWLGLRRTRSCTPAKDVAAIIDDSGSMEENDPLDIRSAAMQLLIAEPGGQDRTLGAVEFGSEAGPLFAPEPIARGEANMLQSLGYLNDDGYAETGVQTNYNAAFFASGLNQPDADARIFLTDGQHDVGEYENGHQGGPRTYVIGLNIGPSGDGEEGADLLGRIAAETGGAYYPLKRHPGDDASIQTGRLQPVFNSIDAKLECQIAPSQATRTLAKVGAPARSVGGRFLGNPGVQIVVSWTVPGAEIGLSGASVRNPNGGLVANLAGKAPTSRHHHRSHPIEQLQTSTVTGATFRTVTIARPKHGSTISIRVAGVELPEPTVVTIQVAPIESLPSQASTTIPAAPVSPASGSPAPPNLPPPPAPPTTWAEQETPNHPVNTFANYHNASGMGPAIAAGQWVQVSCRVYDPTIASVNPDGYWYRIASSPWNNAYYAPANTFMNGDPYGGPYTHNTDFSVAVC